MGALFRAGGACSREIGNLLPNNQHQRRTCYASCHILYPVSAAHTSIFQMDSNSTSYKPAVLAPVIRCLGDTSRPALPPAGDHFRSYRFPNTGGHQNLFCRKTMLPAGSHQAPLYTTTTHRRYQAGRPSLVTPGTTPESSKGSPKAISSSRQWFSKVKSVS